MPRKSRRYVRTRQQLPLRICFVPFYVPLGQGKLLAALVRPKIRRPFAQGLQRILFARPVR